MVLEERSRRLNSLLSERISSVSSMARKRSTKADWRALPRDRRRVFFIQNLAKGYHGCGWCFSAIVEWMNEIIFEVTQEADGRFCAECLTESIFTQGDTWQDLRANVKEAVEAYYFDRAKPPSVRLHLVR